MSSFKNRNRRHYPNGYLPKIEYWSGILNEAIDLLDVDGIRIASDKVLYFTTRQMEWYQKNGKEFA